MANDKIPVRGVPANVKIKASLIRELQATDADVELLNTWQCTPGQYAVLQKAARDESNVEAAREAAGLLAVVEQDPMWRTFKFPHEMTAAEAAADPQFAGGPVITEGDREQILIAAGALDGQTVLSDAAAFAGEFTKQLERDGRIIKRNRFIAEDEEQRKARLDRLIDTEFVPMANARLALRKVNADVAEIKTVLAATDDRVARQALEEKLKNTVLNSAEGLAASVKSTSGLYMNVRTSPEFETFSKTVADAGGISSWSFSEEGD